jgi:hypothetical protein
VKLNILRTKEKYDVYFKYFTKYFYLSRIHIINSGTWLCFHLSLYVARPFTNGNFGIAGASEIFALNLCLILICKQVYTCGGVRGPRVCKVLGGPRTRNR